MSPRRKRKKQGRAPSRHAPDGGDGAARSEGPKPWGSIPGGLFYLIPIPAEYPSCETLLVHHVRAAQARTPLAGIPDSERHALVVSLAGTLSRAEYHRKRFLAARQTLDARRKNLPGEIFWDAAGQYVHFEMQAFCGAARMVADELVYIAARRAGVETRKAARKPWETADLVRGENVPAACATIEIEILRRDAAWFGTLNTYRNSVFHHGWRHGVGHADADDPRMSATNPAMNALLVPDQGSLIGRSKPFSWTYADGWTVDRVVSVIAEGLERVVSAICNDAWGTPAPIPGKAPVDEHPNMIVTLLAPAIVDGPTLRMIPLFSSEERARAFETLSNQATLELVRVPIVTSVSNEPAITFSLRGLEELPGMTGSKSLEVVFDPEPETPDWSKVRASDHVSIDLEPFFSGGTHRPLTLPTGDIEAIYAWRLPTKHEWS